jgi:hypothetical protein
MIRAVSEDAGRRAAEENKTPYVLYNAEELDDFPPFPFPNLGDHEPEGWRLCTTLFCDKSGMGAPGEPALTIEQLKEKIRGILLLSDTLDQTTGFGIVEEGQFQVHLGVFRKL